MAQLLQVGRTFRSATGIPHQFALRVYVPAEELDAVYAPLVPRALSPEEAGVNELTEQLARLAEPGQEPLPPAVEPLWTLPFSAAPRGRDMLAAGAGDFPVYHPPQRLRRSLRLVALAEEEGGQPLPNLLIPEDAVRAAGDRVSREHFVPVHARQSAFTVPMAWFSLFTAQDHTESFHHGNRVHRCAVPVDLATRRVVRAAQVVEDAGGEDLEDLAEDLTHLGRWLGAFSANSLVVLHYGSLADPFQPDESPQDFSDAVELLAARDTHGAAVAFRRLMHRWLRLAHLESAS
ncbi:hypothetical protein [Kocuria sp. CPCC 205263]|uniref:hypothetical protein n=1 Tax=Kocuria sp. CPCC 205263 TaxID=3073555 RepID=UPI0034D64CCF